MDARTLIQQLQHLRKVPVAEIDWHYYCELMRQLCRANGAAVVNLTGISNAVELLGMATDLSEWSPLEALPADRDLFTKSQELGYAQSPVANNQGPAHIALVVVLKGLASHYLLLTIPLHERAQLNEFILRALLCTDFEQANLSNKAENLPEDIREMLDLTTEVMQQPKFQEAALALVNGITIKWTLRMAAFAWMNGDAPKLCAINHLDRFERNSPQTTLIESAMRSSLLMGQEIIWSQATREQSTDESMAELADDLSAQHLAILPVKDAEGQVCGILLIAFAGKSSPPPSLEQLMLALDLLQPRLTDLYQRSLGIGSKTVNGLNRISSSLFGPEHGVAKLVGAVVLGLGLYAAFGTWNYRIEASAQLSTEATRLISAPFDARIEQVNVTAGDQVKAGTRLLSLDTRELEQQKAEQLAEISKANADTDKSRAEGRLADMEMSKARLEQAAARLKRIQFYLQQAVSVAPFDGVVVEGEKKDLMGAPVKKGDKIFKIAKIEGLYVLLAVTERQMRHITTGASAEISLLSQFEYSVPIRINSVIPVAQVKGQEGNQFMIVAELMQAPQPWWRPGMTGLARIDVGPKNIAWILTHRLIDNIRMLLWW